MTYPLPLELQNSYLRRTNYPENLVPSGTATHRSKLVSYRKRLDEAESDLCLVDGEDAVDDVFEIGMIDLETGDGKGAIAHDTQKQTLISGRTRQEKHTHSR
jgi:hypothetical protein